MPPPFEERRQDLQGIGMVVGDIRDSLRDMREDVRATRTAFDLHKDDVIVRLDRLEQRHEASKKGLDLKVTSIVALVAASVGGIFTAIGERIFR